MFINTDDIVNPYVYAGVVVGWVTCVRRDSQVTIAYIHLHM